MTILFSYLFQSESRIDSLPRFSGSLFNQIDAIPPNSVLYISSPPHHPNAVYGGLMSTRAKHLGAAGTVVDGRIRDLQEHRDLEYPVFAREVGTTAPAEVVRVSEVSNTFFIVARASIGTSMDEKSPLTQQHLGQRPRPTPQLRARRHHPTRRLSDRRSERRSVLAKESG